MQGWSVRAAAVAALVTAPVSAQPESTRHSAATLVSDVASIRAGEPFTVGLHITLADGWRTPWRNAGDVGNGLLAAWQLPAGFRADSFAYPIPERIEHPPVASYGYTGAVVILARIHPPAELEAGRSVRLALTADYVICGHTCIPVRAEPSIELPTGDAPPRPSAHAALIRRHADRVPVTLPEWSVRAARTDGGFVIGITPPADWDGSFAGAYFFPTDPALLRHAAGQPVERTAAGEYRMHLTASPYLQGEPKRLEGVLVLPHSFDARGRRGIAVSSELIDTPTRR